MYSVFADDLCIYDDVSPSEQLSLNSPKLTLADNAAGSFSFTMPMSNIGYTEVERMKSEIVVIKDGTEIWSGRVISEEKDYWNSRKMVCEGELAYLNDILQPPAAYEDVEIRAFLQAVIANYNKVINDNNVTVSQNRLFQVGITSVPAYLYGGLVPENITCTTNLETTFDVIKTNVLDKYEGHLRIRKVNGVRYLDYIHDDYFANTNSQEIDFHSNLMDFTRNWDETELATVVIPYGKEIEEDEDEGKTGLAFKLKKTRNKNTKTYNVEFQFTFNNPGVPSDYYVTDTTYKTNSDGTETAETTSSLGSYDHKIWMTFKEQGHSTHDWSDTSETWTMKAGTDTNKTWNKTVENLSPNKTYVWRAWVARYRSNQGGGVIGSDNMGGKFDTGEHSFTVQFTDGELDGIEKLTNVRSVNNDKEYVINQTSVDNFGWIEKVVKWDWIDTPQKLLTMANWYLTDYQFNNMIIQLSALDLHYLDTKYEAIKLLDKVRAISKPHGMDRVFPVTKLDIPLDSPENTIYTLGDKERNSYTKSSNASKSDIYSQLSSLPTSEDVLREIGSAGYRMLIDAFNNAGQIIDTHTNGYITITTDDRNNMSNELWITDTQDYTQATNFWRWNMGGLGHGYVDTNDGNKIKYNVAITMDGSIVANFIKVGQMSVDRVKMYGLMAVYDQLTGTVPGGYIGYGRGEIGYTNPTQYTDGIMISNTKNVDANGYLTPNPRYFIVTSAGVRANAGAQSFYLTDNYVDGQVSGAGALIVSNNFTFQASGLILKPSVVTDPNTGRPYEQDIASRGEITFGNGKLVVNKGHIVGSNNAYGVTDTVEMGRGNITISNGMITAITEWSQTAYNREINDIVVALRDKVDWSTYNTDIGTIWSWVVLLAGLHGYDLS